MNVRMYTEGIRQKCGRMRVGLIDSRLIDCVLHVEAFMKHGTVAIHGSQHSEAIKIYV